jgi:hypothetical protein
MCTLTRRKKATEYRHWVDGHKDGDVATTDDAADLIREARDDLAMTKPYTTASLSRGCLLGRDNTTTLSTEPLYPANSSTTSMASPATEPRWPCNNSPCQRDLPALSPTRPPVSHHGAQALTFFLVCLPMQAMLQLWRVQNLPFPCLPTNASHLTFENHTLSD